MAGYSDLFSYNKMPTVGMESKVIKAQGLNGFDQGFTRYAVNKGGIRKASDNDLFENMMAGYDAKTDELTKKLRSIYDSYETNFKGFTKDYKADMEPIMEALNKDIGNLQEWSAGYQDLVTGMAPRFDAIEVERSPTARRAEYMGNVASQYGAAEDAMRRQMASQGFNPNSNTGATRDFALKRAAAMAGASNKAQQDWHQQRNMDVQADQQAAATYAGLQKGVGDTHTNIMQARAGLGDMVGNIYSSEMDAARLKLAEKQARAAGYEGVAGMNEARRSQTLELNDAKQNRNYQTALAGAQMSAGLDRQWKTVNPKLARFGN